MLGLGGAGVGVFSTAYIGMVVCAVFIIDGLYFMPDRITAMEDSTGIVPPVWYNLHWICLGIFGGAFLVFIGGLVMAIIGFSLAKLYKKRANLTFNTYSDIINDSCRYGFSIKI